MSPVTKLVGEIPGVNKLAGGISKGVSKLNDATGGVLGKAWGAAKEAGPLLAMAGPEGEMAAGAIDVGSKVQDTVRDLSGGRKHGMPNLTQEGMAQDYKMHRFY